MHHLRTLARKRRILEAARQPEDSGIQPEDFDIDSKDSDREPEDSDLDPKDSEEVEPEDSKVVKRATAEKTYIDREISSTFLSMTLYMAGVSAIDLRNLEGEESISLALTTPSAREVGKRVCGFVPEEWLRLYKAGTQCGSEIFDLENGFYRNQKVSAQIRGLARRMVQVCGSVVGARRRLSRQGPGGPHEGAAKSHGHVDRNV